MNLKSTLVAIIFTTVARLLVWSQNSGAFVPDKILDHVRTLSSDEFEGRGPGTQGEQLTVKYLEKQFKQLKLAPANPDGSYFQSVTMIGLTCLPSINWSAGGHDLGMSFPSNCVVWTKRFVTDIAVTNSDVVFVGYGTVAPEYGWDDYKGVDVRGKTIIMLIGDPAIPDPKNPGKLDDKMFKGRAMTYYGRWTYKYEIAAEKGAAAAIIVHETGPAGYPWVVVVGSNSRENFDLDSPDQNAGRVPVEGWINQAQAEKLFATSGEDFWAMKKAALSRSFRPVSLKSQASFKLSVNKRRVDSRNVVAKIPCSDSKLKDECIVYSAHWDHLGRDPKLKGDQIYNGALDNATGVAGLLELARVFSEHRAELKRTVLFAAVTGEEKGLLGAKYYARQPLIPLKKTVANINMDGLNVWGTTSDIGVIGKGQNTLEDILAKVARREHRTLSDDPEPERGRYFRSDHFEFAKVGVPALYTKPGENYIGKPADFGLKVIQNYTDNDYHKVTDEIKPDWNFTGAAQDLYLLYGVGLELAKSPAHPKWKSGSEFKAKYEALHGNLH